MQIGTKLWFVPEDGQPKQVTVVKVGIKWVEAYGISTRIETSTGDVEDGGRCYPSREAYEALNAG